MFLSRSQFQSQNMSFLSQDVYSGELWTKRTNPRRPCFSNDAKGVGEASQKGGERCTNLGSSTSCSWRADGQKCLQRVSILGTFWQVHIFVPHFQFQPCSLRFKVSQQIRDYESTQSKYKELHQLRMAEALERKAARDAEAQVPSDEFSLFSWKLTAAFVWSWG